MGVAKSLNRLAILGLLSCAGAWAQSTVSVKVGLSLEGPIFLVDGQAYTSTQTFQWSVGSSHQVYFVQTAEADGTLSNHQYPLTPDTRFTFGAWSLTGQSSLGAQSTLFSIVVGPTLSQVLGQVSREVILRVYFTDYNDPSLACSAAPVSNDPRPGVLLIGSACFSSSATTWVSPGNLNLTAAPFPGFIFDHWVINGNIFTDASLNYSMVLPSSITGVFIRAKRVRIRSNPLGLSILVDHQLVTPGPLANGPYSGDPYCPVDFSLLSISFPVGYVPLCVGDFDYMPGTQHILGAPDVQVDSHNVSWIFTNFSNGLGQGAIYTANSDTNTTDVLTANFVLGLVSQVITSPRGLKVNVDGQDDSAGSRRVWAVGGTHHLVAPLTQTDASGHPWKFVNWSSGGAADQTFTVPSGIPGLTVTAVYALVGNLQVDSVPSGLPFRVDGVPCTTPCIVQNKAVGAQVQVVAAASVSPDPLRRYDFKSWNDGNTANTFVVTVTDQTQVFSATYQKSYKLSVVSQPANQSLFTTNPSSADGFFADGTNVNVTAVPQNGYKFQQWTGDLSGNTLTSQVSMNGPKSGIALMDGAPFIFENGVKSAAGDLPSGAVAPGSDISIFGVNLAGSTKVAPAGLVSQAIDDVSATVDGRPLALMFVSPVQINAQLFSDLQDGDYTLTLHRTGKADAIRNFRVRRNAPGLFQWYPLQGLPTVAALHENGTLITADSPAAVNETITIYGTGFGPYDRPLLDGFPTAQTGDWNLVDPVKVTLDGQTYTPVSARSANGVVGMSTIRVKLTGPLPSGLVDIKATVNSVDSNTAKLPVK